MWGSGTIDKGRVSVCDRVKQNNDALMAVVNNIIFNQHTQACYHLSAGACKIRRTRENDNQWKCSNVGLSRLTPIFFSFMDTCDFILRACNGLPFPVAETVANVYSGI